MECDVLRCFRDVILCKICFSCIIYAMGERVRKASLKITARLSLRFAFQRHPEYHALLDLSLYVNAYNAQKCITIDRKNDPRRK